MGLFGDPAREDNREMPEDPNESAPTPEPSPTQSDTPTKPEPAQDTDWKAEARKWEGLAKANKDAAAKLAEIEDAAKSEAEKAAERLAAAEAKVAEFEQREQVNTWKAEVSKETGVPADVLAGSTKDEIEAHAATLAPLIVKPGPGARGPIVPVEGTGSASGLGGPAADFAAHLKSQLGQ